MNNEKRVAEFKKQLERAKDNLEGDVKDILEKFEQLVHSESVRMQEMEMHMANVLERLGFITADGRPNEAFLAEMLSPEDFDRWASAFYKGPKAPPLEHVISAIDVYDMATAETERTMIDKILCTHCEYGTIVERDTLFDQKSQTYQTGLFVECKGRLIGPNLKRMGLNTALMPLCTRCPYFKKN